MIFQDPFASLNPVRTVFEHLELPLRIHGIAWGREAQRRVYELLATVGLVAAPRVRRVHSTRTVGRHAAACGHRAGLTVEPEIILARRTRFHARRLDPHGSAQPAGRPEAQRHRLLVHHPRPRFGPLLRRPHDRAVRRSRRRGGGQRAADGFPRHPYTQLLISAVPDPAVPRRQGAAQSAEVRRLPPFRRSRSRCFRGSGLHRPPLRQAAPSPPRCPR